MGSLQKLKELFIEARSRDHQKLLHDLRKLLSSPSSQRSAGALKRIRRRFLELQDIDFFASPLRSKLENLLARADEVPLPDEKRPPDPSERAEANTTDQLF